MFNPVTLINRSVREKLKARVRSRDLARANEYRGLSLLDFIPRASPRCVAPRHLAPLLSIYQRIAAGERVRAVVDVSAQHGKTTCASHALPWLLLEHPTWPLAYVTFSQTQANRKSLDAQYIALRTGLLRPDDNRVTMEEWRLPEGGGCLFAGVGGPVSGNPARVMVFDDFFKNREEADSQLLRDRRMDWLTSVAIPRLPEDGSALVKSTRWHEDDPSGRIRRGDLGPGWEFVSLPFLATRDDEGKRVPDDQGDDVLWPRRGP